MAGELQAAVVVQDATAQYTVTLYDDQTPAHHIQPADLDSLVYSLVSLDDYDSGAPKVLNSRSNVDASSRLESNGHFHLELTAADNAMVDDSRSVERHLLLLTVGFSGKTGIIRQMILVENKLTAG